MSLSLRQDPTIYVENVTVKGGDAEFVPGGGYIDSKDHNGVRDL
jgi:hypothetical protein